MAASKDATGGEGNGGYNLRKIERAEEKGKNGKEKKEQKHKRATPVRTSRGRKKMPPEDKKGTRKDRSLSGVKRLEEYWPGNEGDEETQENEVEEQEQDKGMDDQEIMEEEEEIRRKKEEEQKEEEKAEERKREKTEIPRPKWNLTRTPIGNKKTENGSQEVRKEMEGIVEAVAQTNNTAQGAKSKDVQGETDLTQSEEQPQRDRDRSKGRQNEEKAEEEMDKNIKKTEETERSEEEKKMEKLEKWTENFVKNYVRSQKEEWETRMADLECMIRTELGGRRERDENLERRRVRNQEEQLRDQIRDLQEKLDQSENLKVELEVKAAQWKAMAEVWRERAEGGKENEERIRSVSSDDEGGGEEAHDGRRTSDTQGSSLGGRDDPSTWRESGRRVGGPGHREELEELEEQSEQEEGPMGPQGTQGNHGNQWKEVRRERSETGTKRTEERRQERGDGRENRIGENEVRRNEKYEKGERHRIMKINPPPRSLTEEEWQTKLNQRRGKRKNMIIEGLTLITRTRKEELENWMMETMNLKVRVEKLDRRAEGGWMARVEEIAHKKAIMKEKTNLKRKGWGVYISHDLTDRQKEVQAWMEKEAENWRKLKKEAWTKYNSMWVEGTWLEWDEKEGTVRQRERKEKRVGRQPFPSAGEFRRR